MRWLLLAAPPASDVSAVRIGPPPIVTERDLKLKGELRQLEERAREVHRVLVAGYPVRRLSD